MKYLLAAIAAAVEALAVALSGLAVIAVPATLLWIITYKLAAGAEVVAALVSGAWLWGHGAPLQFDFTAQQIVDIGAGQEAVRFPLSLPLLGIACLTVAGGVRAGRRIHAAGGANPAQLFISCGSAAAGFLLISTIAASLAYSLSPHSMWMLAFRPLWLFLMALFGGVLWAAREMLPDLIEEKILPKFGVQQQAAFSISQVFGNAAVIFAAVALGLVALSALLLFFNIAINFVDYVRLSQSLHFDLMGVIISFLAQLLFLPVALIWALAWVSGVGFSIGEATLFSPFQLASGPLPALPIFAWVPADWGSFGIVAPLIVTVVALSMTLLFRSRLKGLTPGQRLATALLVAALSWVCGFILFGIARGSLGPGTLVYTGSDPVSAASAIAVEVLIGVAFGAWAYRSSPLTKLTETGTFFTSFRRRSLTETDEAQTLETEPLDTTDVDSGFGLLAARAREDFLAEQDRESKRDAPVSNDTASEHSDDSAELGEYESLDEVVGQEQEQYDTAELLRNFEWNKNDRA
ncbi:DUF6350 family protein [Canibacter zhoujuaniae]|uniref:cell division protein PerM n=1 Tax=Canibacter zhoujuaniae TaxID=2708343 RepID=UPI0014226674|nr:DUF6350 family protein [Canibacter zhoujuaniae]